MSNEVYGKFNNKNYLLLLAILVAFIGVLYFYRFLFATVAISYVLGCVAYYCGFHFNYLSDFIGRIKCHLVENDSKKNLQDTSKGCAACGSRDCMRHDGGPQTEPWVELQVHKQLDQAIEEFYNTILDQFVNSWCSKITLQPFFVDELRHQLRYASACLLGRATQINYSRFITERLVPCALRHYTLCAGLFDGAPLLDSKLAIHPAAANRNAELKYLRAITNAIMPYLLKNTELQNSVFRVLIREIFAGWVLLSLADVLADPHILNTLIVLATGDETMAKLPSTPNYKVEFLETFVRQTESVYTQRGKILHLDLEFVINDQDHFYAFMQYLKTTSHIHLLQFYKDIKSFQTRLLNPEMGSEEEASLNAEALDIFERYLAPDSVGRLPLPADLSDELSDLLRHGKDIKRLQTSRALYQAARQSHSVLEKNMLPRFLHSEEYYKLFIGSRMPSGYQKHMYKKPQERLVYSALKLGYRLKNALKSQTIDGQVLDSLSNSDISEDENMDNMDILKYLESFAAHDGSEHDMSTYKVVLTNVETRLQVAPRRGSVRVFTVAVHRIDSSAGARLWSVERSENDFHLLRSKLHEFHGDRLLHNLTLPSRRDNSPLENLRYKYEDFLQRLLQKSLLQSSELLHLFLTVDSDFSLVVQASTLTANSSDLTNIYQSVTYKLRKEKGQHLESFLKNLLVSSDMDRFQALKHGTNREIEEAQEVSEDAEVEHNSAPVTRESNARNIRTTVFENNFDIEPAVIPRGMSLQNSVVGFTQCLLYFLTKVAKVRGIVSCVIGSVFGLARESIDELFVGWLNNTLCRLLSERRLAHLIRLGHAEIFGKKSSVPKPNRIQQCDLAREQLLNSIPGAVNVAAGPGLPFAVLRMFEIIQSPQLNKQLFYNLLDLCLLELFPELSHGNGTETNS